MKISACCLHTSLAFLIAFMVVGGSHRAAAQDSQPRVETAQISAQPVETAPTIDGMLDEAAWDDTPGATDFLQLEPREGASPSQRTEVHVLYGQNALYVGAMLYDEHPERIRARLARRDQRNQADWFEVSLDSYYDQQTARTFAVNAAGVQRDGSVQSGGGPGGDLDTSWDAIWESDVQITSNGWIAEIRIPYSELRFSEADEQRWGVQFRRRIPRTSEVVEWPLIPQSERSSLVAQYGILTGLRNLEAGRNIKVAPYTVGRVRTYEDADIPGTMAATSAYDVGGYFEVGLGSNTTLNATINPDFGQVEADPAVLNLSAFETFFPERRPFFVQGTDVLEFGLGRRSDLLYTRRIGGTAPVLGALKLTGRSRSELSYALLGASTGHDFTPTRNYAAGRLRQDLGQVSSVGGIVTAFDGPAADEEDGRRRSLAGGLDWDLRFNSNTYQLQGYLSGTHRRTTGPDPDPATGLAGQAEVGRIQGNWTYNLDLTVRDAEFDPNDLGRMRRNNYIQLGTFLNHEFNGGQPFGPFQNGGGFLALNQSWSYQDRIDRGFGFFSRFRFLTDGFRSLEFGADGENVFGGYDLFETRGLWPRAEPRSISGEASLSTDTRRSWEVEAEMEATTRSDGGTEWSTGLEGEWNVGSRVKLSAEVSYESEQDAVEWASNETFVRQSGDAWAIGAESGEPSDLDPDDLRPLEQELGELTTALSPVASTGSVGGAPAYYVPVYGARDTERINVTLRSNVALTRNLSFEFFGQLFGARGRYSDFRILSSRDEMNSYSSYPRRHDFATSSFLTNAVLRWEFRPGSELFLVWSQDRALDRNDPFFYDRRTGSPYDQPATARLTDAFDDFPRNAFIVKLRYMFN